MERGVRVCGLHSTGKLLKNLELLILQHGLTSPCRQTFIDNIFTGSLLTPFDSRQIARLILASVQVDMVDKVD